MKCKFPDKECDDRYFSSSNNCTMCRLPQWKKKLKTCPYSIKIRSCACRPKGQKELSSQSKVEQTTSGSGATEDTRGATPQVAVSDSAINTQETKNLIEEVANLEREIKEQQDAYDKEFKEKKRYNENYATNINNLQHILNIKKATISAKLEVLNIINEIEKRPIACSGDNTSTMRAEEYSNSRKRIIKEIRDKIGVGHDNSN